MHHQVNWQLEQSNDLPSDCKYSVAEVRQIFAASMTQAQPNKTETNKSSSVPMASVAAASIPPSSAGVLSSGSTGITSTSHAVKAEEEEDLSFAQVFKRAQERQAENDKLKEDMFRRGECVQLIL